jgi:WD40 repeat protein
MYDHVNFDLIWEQKCSNERSGINMTVLKRQQKKLQKEARLRDQDEQEITIEDDDDEDLPTNEPIEWRTLELNQ